ncbi:MAG: DUF2478 domain-containing protein [Sandaracinaceae bacterium]|nr:DUF2478 domain-containing protein [Sandaracinaceae bacterium]
MGRWVAVVGSGPDGRGAVLDELAGALQAEGARVGGFIQRTRWAGDTIVGYDLVHPTRGESCALAREDPHAPELCRWRFVEPAFETARRWTLEGEHDVVMLEAGRLEAAARGHWQTVLDALAAGPLVVLAVRRGVLAGVALALPDPLDAIELPAGAGDVEGFVARVAEHARGGAGSDARTNREVRS